MGERRWGDAYVHQGVPRRVGDIDITGLRLDDVRLVVGLSLTWKVSGDGVWLRVVGAQTQKVVVAEEGVVRSF